MPAYTLALQGLHEFERIWVLYHLDRTAEFKPLVTPYLDTAQH
jgi:tRNA (Thr-GGU) A37 N-methylase